MTRNHFLTALGVVLGLQMLRGLFPLLVFGLGDRFGWPAPVLGLIGLGTLGMAFPLWPAMRRGSACVAPAALSLVALRLLFQIRAVDPVASAGIAAAGVAAFLALLAALRRAIPARDVALGVLAGIGLDAALHAAAGTRPLHASGGWAAAAAVSVALATGVTALCPRRKRPAQSPASSFAERTTGLADLGWGPLFFLSLEWLSNVARLSARTGLSTPAAGTVVVLGAALAIVVAGAVCRVRRGSLATTLAAGLLLAALAWAAESGSLPAIPLLLAGQIAAAFLALRLGASRPGIASGVAFGTGFALLAALVFAAYGGYQLPLPFGRAAVHAFAAAALATAAVRRPARPDPARLFRRAPVVAMVLAAAALLPAARSLRRPAPPPPLPADAAPGELRIITLNLHNGFDEHGRFALDRMVAYLRDASPDVIALQEVSRGWLTNGSADLFELIFGELGFHGVHGPSEGADWGNAIFSRLPIMESTTHPLPPADLLVKRGWTTARFDAGGRIGGFLLHATHFHHPDSPADEAVRVRAARHLAGQLSQETGILLGDFNAEPAWDSMRILREAGWTHALDTSEGESGATWPASDPHQRIDAILLRGELKCVEARVGPAVGSDHRPVEARIR
ncbi:MAG: endonuclease/exonuclease/phosphatase family protein [Gemmatimonadota bacterium]|jgi:endonuclease/exonuclease/phosphatase family metal-dependent hydrolase|nr:endonuclease/exonuclease/phosphatase family protein [Gemmatimonadota bacterium]MDP6802668.1 endonuclease/exonuclease/phosphatase family protein [Gemmatimonadota bacterium]MDP7031667.1 endonuclease/exonuclease/phosphatase family protein [Gemmatimonadota bacterium]